MGRAMGADAAAAKGKGKRAATAAAAAPQAELPSAKARDEAERFVTRIATFLKESQISGGWNPEQVREAFHDALTAMQDGPAKERIQVRRCRLSST